MKNRFPFASVTVLLAAFACAVQINAATTSAQTSNTSKHRPVVTAAVETDSVAANVEDDAADDATIWYNHKHPAKSLVLGTDKTFGVIAYDLQGKQLQTYEVGRINNIDVRQGVFESIDLVAASNRTTNSIDFWKVDRKTQLLNSIGSISSKLGAIYGFCLGVNATTKEVYAFANSKTGQVEQWKLNEEQGRISGTLVRELKLPSQVEGMVADDELGRLYVGVEEAGIYRFEMEADGSKKGKLIDNSSESNNAAIKFDIEGLTIFTQGYGKGYLIASVQGNNSYAVFDRAEKNKYLGSFAIETGKFDGTQETDGIYALSKPLGPNYPLGIFVCQDGVNFDGAIKKPQNFKYVSWATIAASLELE